MSRESIFPSSNVYEAPDDLPPSLLRSYGGQAGFHPSLMKLLMISGDRSILQGRKGAFWYTLQELRKYWDRIDILCPSVPSVAVKLKVRESLPSEDGGGEVYFHPCPRGLWYQPWWIKRRGQELWQEHHHDVMTVHSYPPFYNDIGARWLASATGIPYALEVHHIVGCPTASSVLEWIGRLLSRLFLPFAARAANAVRVVNQSVRDILVFWGVAPEKIHLVSSFYLDRALFARDIHPPVSYDLSFSGRIVKNKRLLTLIEALRDLPNVRLLVIGDGPERYRCEVRVRRLGLEGRVAFVGWLGSAEAVIGAIQTARIFVMNSSSEGGPRSALEAMACGLPVIATPVGIMPEVMQDGINGVFTDGSIGDLRQKIMHLLSDDALCERIGREARRVLERYDRSVLMKQYADFLQALA